MMGGAAARSSFVCTTSGCLIIMQWWRHSTCDFFSPGSLLFGQVGHALGLFHDGTSSAEYYTGIAPTFPSWGPIMGASYKRDITQVMQPETRRLAVFDVSP
jgi:hypothetical protein